MTVWEQLSVDAKPTGRRPKAGYYGCGPEGAYVPILGDYWALPTYECLQGCGAYSVNVGREHGIRLNHTMVAAA